MSAASFLHARAELLSPTRFRVLFAITDSPFVLSPIDPDALSNAGAEVVDELGVTWVAWELDVAEFPRVLRQATYDISMSALGLHPASSTRDAARDQLRRGVAWALAALLLLARGGQ